MSFDYMSTLPPKELNRYQEKLDFVGLDDCPYRLPANLWKNDPTKWPEVTALDIYCYLINTPGVYTKQTMKNFRSLEAHKLFSSGWVQTIVHHLPPNANHIILMANVTPSWRVTDTPHKTWVALERGEDGGAVTTAHCNCMAGLGESCSHVGALLFKVEAAVRLGYTSEACTSRPCEWNTVFTKKVTADKICDITFYTEKAKENLRKTERKRKIPPPLATSDEQGRFLAMLATAKCNPIGLSTFEGYGNNFEWKQEAPTQISLPQSLRHVYFGTDISQVSQPAISPEQVTLVETATRKQSNSMAWFEQRAGRITGSQAHRVLHTKQTSPAPSIIRTICIPQYKPIKTKAVTWGRENEEKALYIYQALHQSKLDSTKYEIPPLIFAPPDILKEHHNTAFTQAGFRISPEYPFVGATADGYVKCDCCGSGVVEVKCPYTWADQNIPPEKWHESDQSHLEPNTSIKKTHPYYSQVQLQMFVTGCNYCDFVTWTPQACVLTRVVRDDDFLLNSLAIIKPFWENHILPELCTRQLEMQREIDLPRKKYCTCQSERLDTTMAVCDNDQCAIKWFHYTCVGIKRKLKNKLWFCSKKCRQTANTNE